MCALLMPSKVLQIGLGKVLHGMSKKAFKTEISSYGFEGALDYVSRRGQGRLAVVAGDVQHQVTDTLRVFNDFLDLFHVATLLHHGLVDAKRVKNAARVKLGDAAGHVIQTRLFPHMTAMNVFRNDVLAAVLNELDSDWRCVLLISAPMRIRDLCDKLCGRSPVHKWLKQVDDKHVTLHKLNLFEHRRSGTHARNTHLAETIKSEHEELLIQCCGYLGHRQTAFLLMPYPLGGEEEAPLDVGADDLNEAQLVERIKQRMDEIEQTLRRKYS